MNGHDEEVINGVQKIQWRIIGECGYPKVKNHAATKRKELL